MDKKKLIIKIHNALGGDGWAYSNYGYDELNSRYEQLEAVADLLLELSTQQGVAAELLPRCSMCGGVAEVSYHYCKKHSP